MELPRKMLSPFLNIFTKFPLNLSLNTSSDRKLKTSLSNLFLLWKAQSGGGMEEEVIAIAPQASYMHSTWKKVKVLIMNNVIT